MSVKHLTVNFSFEKSASRNQSYWNWVAFTEVKWVEHCLWIFLENELWTQHLCSSWHNILRTFSVLLIEFFTQKSLRKKSLEFSTHIYSGFQKHQASNLKGLQKVLSLEIFSKLPLMNENHEKSVTKHLK